MANKKHSGEVEIPAATAGDVSEVDTVLMQHPHHRDVPPVAVPNTGEALTPFMVQGYVQFKG